VEETRAILVFYGKIFCFSNFCPLTDPMNDTPETGPAPAPKYWGIRISFWFNHDYKNN
jgi:hypothetical protein